MKRQRSSTTTAVASPQSPPMELEDDGSNYTLLPKPADWFTTLISLQSNLINTFIVSLASPIASLFSLAADSYPEAEETKHSVESVPAQIGHNGYVILRRLWLGFLGAAYVCMVLVVVLLLAAVIGIAVVQIWVEEPVVLRERLHFDYTNVNPYAVFDFGGFKKRHLGVPVGHTVQVYLMLLMPESDYNRDIGVFQVAAELLTINGKVIERSSQPCMLQFRSFPIRLTQTFVMGIPLLLGLSGETQKVTLQILSHKEGVPRSGAIRVALIPRAGTSSLPQLYEAEIIMNSQLPWTKELVHNWKWTFYVWMSLYLYMMFVMVLVCCCRPLVFPMMPSSLTLDEKSDRNLTDGASRQLPSRESGDSETEELVRRWQQRRSKRKAMFMHDPPTETGGSSASSFSITREDMGAPHEEDVGDLESVCSDRLS